MRRAGSWVSAWSRTPGTAKGFGRPFIGGGGDCRTTRDSRRSSERARPVASVTLLPHYWLSAGRTGEVENGFSRLILGSRSVRILPVAWLKRFGVRLSRPRQEPFP